MLRKKPLSKAEQERIVKNAGVPVQAGLNWLLKRNVVVVGKQQDKVGVK